MAEHPPEDSGTQVPSEPQADAAASSDGAPSEEPPATDNLIGPDQIAATVEVAETQAAATPPGDTPPAAAASEQAGANAASHETPEAIPASVPAEEVEPAMHAMREANGEESKPTAASTPSATTPFESPDFATASPATKAFAIDMLDDVELDVKIELGRTEMYIEDVLGLGAGSVVKLDKAAGDPVDIFINDRLVARGEVLVLNDSFCVRINDILSPIPELERDE